VNKRSLKCLDISFFRCYLFLLRLQIQLLHHLQIWYKACLDFTLCSILYRECKYREALDAFKQNASVYKGTPIELEYLVSIAELYGNKFDDKKSAKSYADKAASINPGDPILRFAYEAAEKSIFPLNMSIKTSIPLLVIQMIQIPMKTL
jgi:hypothetical protein